MASHETPAPCIDVPVAVRTSAVGRGAVGEQWLAELPDLAAELASRWSLSVVGRPLSGGTTSYVTRAITAAGEDVVLKIALPEDDFEQRVRTVVAAGGHGYVRLFAYDLERHATLMEALGPSMTASGMSPEQTIDALCPVLAQAWQVPRSAIRPDVVVVEKAVALHRMIRDQWEQLGRPCPRPVIDRALAFAERRSAAFDPDRSVVVHGDPHASNALRVMTERPGAESGFLFVDPDGFLEDPTYDLGVVLRSWCGQLLAASDAPRLARRYAARLAAGTGLDADAIWEWGFVERVSTGLYALFYGHRTMGRQHLETAELLLNA
jgi:streptomycin 6-kinase